MDYFTACMSQPLSQHCSTQNSPWAHPAICIPRDGACTLRRPRRIGGRRMSRSRPTRAAPPQPPNQPARAYTPRPLPTPVLPSPPHHTHTLPAQRRPPRSAARSPAARSLVTTPRGRAARSLVTTPRGRAARWRRARRPPCRPAATRRRGGAACPRLLGVGGRVRVGVGVRVRPRGWGWGCG